MKQFFKDYFFPNPSLWKITKEENKFILETGDGELISINEDEIESVHDSSDGIDITWYIGAGVFNVIISIFILLSIQLPEYIQSSIFYPFIVLIFSYFTAFHFSKILSSYFNFPYVSILPITEEHLSISLKEGKKLNFKKEVRTEDEFSAYKMKKNISESTIDKLAQVIIALLLWVGVFSMFISAFAHKGEINLLNILQFLHLIFVSLFILGRLFFLLFMYAVLVFIILVSCFLIAIISFILTSFINERSINITFTTISIDYSILFGLLILLFCVLYPFKKYRFIKNIIDFNIVLIILYFISFTFFAVTFFIAHQFYSLEVLKSLQELKVLGEKIQLKTELDIILFFNVGSICLLVIFIFLYLIIFKFKEFVHVLYIALIRRGSALDLLEKYILIK